MIAAMAAFAVEDAFTKTVTKQLPIGQVLVLFGFLRPPPFFRRPPLL
jgi:hypothetical protein